MHGQWPRQAPFQHLGQQHCSRGHADLHVGASRTHTRTHTRTDTHTHAASPASLFLRIVRFAALFDARFSAAHS